MSQKLSMPLYKCKIADSMDARAHSRKYGASRIGIDMVSAGGDRTLWASGDGMVMSVCYDHEFGKIAAVLYTNVYNMKSGKSENIVFRYFYMDSIAVFPGQRVTKGTVLGMHGKTDLNTGGHLYMEADTDTLYPMRSPACPSLSAMLSDLPGAFRKNLGTLVNPMDWLDCITSEPATPRAEKTDGYIAKIS